MFDALLGFAAAQSRKKRVALRVWPVRAVSIEPTTAAAAEIKATT